MQAGKLRHKVTIQGKSVTRSPTGAEVVTRVDLKTVWAEAKPLSGREVLKSTAEIATGTTVFSTRYRAILTPAKWLVWQDRLFDIEQVIDVGGRGREMEILGTEVIR